MRWIDIFEKDDVAMIILTLAYNGYLDSVILISFPKSEPRPRDTHAAA